MSADKLSEVYKRATGKELAGVVDDGKDEARTRFLDGLLSFLAETADRQQPDGGLYVDPSGFNAFCNEGGNVALYESLTRLLADELCAGGASSVVDVGCGSGRALVPALRELAQRRGDTTPRLRVTAVEPSTASLQLCAEALAGLPLAVDVGAFGVSAQQFINEQQQVFAADAAIATFSLSSQPRSERAGILRWLRQHCGVLLVGEFDCQLPGIDAQLPDELADPRRFVAVVDRYAAGAAEHRGSANEQAILRGFLYPTFMGNFSGPRFTFEQTKEAWLRELADAGFASVEARPVSPFWWSDCYLFVCRAA